MTEAAVSNNDFDIGTRAPSEYLRGLAARAIELQTEIDEYEAVAKAKQIELNEIKQKRMVEAMQQCQQSEMTDSRTGWKFKIMLAVVGSMPKDEPETAEARQKGIAYLAANGGDGIIKTVVSVPFAKGDANRAIDTFEKLREMGLPAEKKEDVHAQSLQAFARERIKNGDGVDLEVLGLNTFEYVKATPPKEDKI